MHSSLWSVPILVAALALPAGANGRAGGPPPERASRGPAFGVARVSVADGDVVLRRAGSGDEIQARAALALLAGDSVATRARSRAEIQLDVAGFVRLNADSELRIVELGSRRFRLEVVRGGASYSQLRGGEADVDLDVAGATVRPLKKGVYRIDVFASGQTTVSVRTGSAEVETDGGVEKLKKGKQATIQGDPADGRVLLAKAKPKDGFDEWNKRRDKLLERKPPNRWVGPSVGFGYWPPFYSVGFGYYAGPRFRVAVVHRGGGGRRGRY